MKSFILLTGFLSISAIASPQSITKPAPTCTDTLSVESPTKSLDIEKLADAIYLAEGGEKARVPYGILSVKTKDPRRVCINTIRNTYQRWMRAGCPDTFINYLSDRYCQGNANWRRNVLYFYGR